MRIIFTNRMKKEYWKLQEDKRQCVDEAIELFRIDPFTKTLRNHPLKGLMKGTRSISAGFDLRIVFEVQEKYTLVIMLAVGSHEEVY